MKTCIDVLKEIIIANEEDVPGLELASYDPFPHFGEGGRTSVAEMNRHGKNEHWFHKLSSDDILFGDFYKNIVLPEVAIGKAMAVVSRVPGDMHIPMMDFDCDVNDENLAKIVEYMRHIGLKGYVLKSGASFHVYGKRVMDRQEWINFLGDMLLCVPKVDARYVGHGLKRGFTAVRITDKGKPHWILPYVVAEV